MLCAQLDMSTGLKSRITKWMSKVAARNDVICDGCHLAGPVWALALFLVNAGAHFYHEHLTRAVALSSRRSDKNNISSRQ